jgi:4-amino-4-deoxy-L-arabinose transferase-like glycosyltransferase
VNRIFYGILAAYLILATTYSIATPIFEASDELWHYPMVKYLADNGLQLPPQDPINIGPWRQEGSQPPLYYMLAAILTAGIDTSDMETVRRVNPHADIGIVRPDGNANMMVHRTEMEVFPWRGTTLAVHIVRFFSIALGLGTVIVTYQLAREIFPDNKVVQLGAAAFVAFLPMFLFISGSVNNDNLSNFLGNLLTLLIVRLLKVTRLPHWRDYALVGIVTGAGLLAKFNIGFLIPLVALALLVVSLRLRDWRPLVFGGVISGTLTVAIAGWWYWRNMQLFGDPTGLNNFLDIVGRRAIPANIAQLWSERHSFTQAFWGFFGGVNVPMPEIIYLIFNIIGGIGLIGAAIFILWRFTRARSDRRKSLPAPKHLSVSGWDGASPQWLPMLITLIWPIISFISYLRWTAETPASQGRLMFGALSCIALWTIVGLTWWLLGRVRPAVITVIAGFFAVVAFAVPLFVIAPAYALPPQTELERTIMSFTTEEGEFSLINLYKAEILNTDVQPEQYVQIGTGWWMVGPADRDWSLFVHLVTPDNVIISQRDIYPGGGKLATSDLPAGRAWDNPIAVWIPFTAYAPMTLDVQIGWNDRLTGERLVTSDGQDTYSIGQIRLMPRTSELNVPNPVRVNFGNLLELVGYEITDLTPQAGETTQLTLYWRGLEKIPDDYKVFANIIDPATLTKYASSDGMPVDWNAPTSTWQPGEIIEDGRQLTVSSDTPTVPGIYELELGLYREAPDGTFPRLRIVTPDGGQAEDFIYLSRIRVLPNGEGS